METNRNGRRPLRKQVAAALPPLRRLRGLTVRELSARLAALGAPLLASGITKIEQGARGVDVDELVALAAALNVPPARLLINFSSGRNLVELLPGRSYPGNAAWSFLNGEAPLPTFKPPTAWVNNLDELIDYEQAKPGPVRRWSFTPLGQAVGNLERAADRALELLDERDAVAARSSLASALRAVEQVSDELEKLQADLLRDSQ